MYPSSSSSSSQNSMGPSPSGLTRYGSTPGSLLTSTVDSVIAERELSSLRTHPPSFLGRYFPGGPTTNDGADSDSTFNKNINNNGKEKKPLLRSYGINEMAAAIGGGGGSWLKGEKLNKTSPMPATNSLVSDVRRTNVSGPVLGTGKSLSGRIRRPLSGPISSLFRPTKRADSEVPYKCLDKDGSTQVVHTYGPVYLVT